LASYQQAIQNAFQEVDNALASVTDLRAQLVADEGYVHAEQRLFELSELRYNEGISSYSDLLDAQRYLFTAQLDAVQTRANLLVAVTQLYQALGGGWTGQ
jgi:outer membrane protein TolC